MLGQRSRWYSVRGGGYPKVVLNLYCLCVIVNSTYMFIYWLAGFLCLEKMSHLLLDPDSVYFAGGLSLLE